MFDIAPSVVAIFIPILAVVGVFAVVITSVIVGGKSKELEHQERLLAMEKGIDLPEPKEKRKRPRYLAIRAWGLVLFALGIAVLIGISAEAGFKHGLWGLTPLLVGLSLLLAASIEKRDLPE